MRCGAVGLFLKECRECSKVAWWVLLIIKEAEILYCKGGV